MATNRFIMPGLNLHGAGCLADATAEIKARNVRKVLIVTDAGIEKVGLLDQVIMQLKKQQLEYSTFTEVKPNPTAASVDAGLAQLKSEHCDLVMSVGGGSPHDCAKAIALLATNGGNIRDFEGMDIPAKASLPLVAVNTTAGTAAEMTRFAVITCEKRHTKMAIINQHLTPSISVNDPLLMRDLPAHITAATGMDALTHAIEAYISTAANPLSDANAEKAISLIATYLPLSVADGQDIVAREMMAYAEFMAGMAFNNASVGYVHALAHQLGAVYDLPHGLCNALLLPHVMDYVEPECKERLQKVAELMRADTIQQALRRLRIQLEFPTSLAELGVKLDDIPKMAAMAADDISGLTSPKPAKLEDIAAIYQAAL